MAGFDFGFNFQPEEAELVRTLLRAAQRRARRLGVRLSFHSERAALYWVVVDGSMVQIEPLTFQLATDLPGVAEGFQYAGLSLKRRRRLAKRLLVEMARALVEFLDYQRELAAFVSGVPVAITVDVGQRTHLTGRMRLLRTATSMYLVGQLDPETMLEEAHTSVEIMLREYARQFDSGTFAQLVGKAHSAGVIDDYLRDQMIVLKDLRRGVKHKGQGVSQAKVDELVHPVLAVCQRIATEFRSPGTTAPGSF